MKLIKTFLHILILLSVLTSVTALTLPEVRLGSSTQKRVVNTDTLVDVYNDGDMTIDNLHLEFIGVSSKFNIEGILSKTTLMPNESLELSVNGFVPPDLNAVDTKGNKISIKIGSLKLEGTYDDGSQVSRTVDIFMEAENLLQFGSGSRITVDGSEKTLRNDRTFDNIERDDVIVFLIEIGNEFDDDGDCEDSENCEIEDIEVVFDSDRDLDFDDSIDFSRIRADRTDTESITFTIPEDIDDGKYDVDIWVTGNDENGALHGERWQITLDIEVPRDFITIKSFELRPQTLECTQRTATLSVTLKNSGTRDQDKVSIFIESARLDIKQSVYNIELDEGDEVTQTLNLNLPSETEPGTYFIQIIANVDNSDETDRDAVQLIVKQCTVTPPPSDDDQDDDDTIDIITIPPTSGVIYGSNKPQSFINSTEFVILLAGIFVLGVLLLFILLVVLIKK